jgi:hypothetical protein
VANTKASTAKKEQETGAANAGAQDVPSTSSEAPKGDESNANARGRLNDGKDEGKADLGTRGARKTENDAELEGNAGDPGFGGNTGPGTGKDAPPETTPRMPFQQPSHAESGPLNPDDAKQQIKPDHGYAESSTDAVYAAVGGRTIAGEDHVGLVDEDGGEVSGDSLFDEDARGNTIAATTVLQRFTYANAPDFVNERLLFTKGQKVLKAQAERVIASLDRKQEPTFAAQEGEEKESGRSKSDAGPNV